MFARLFNTKTHGQICVMMNDDESEDDTTKIDFHFQPPELGICSQSNTYYSTPEEMEDWLEKLTEEEAVSTIDEAYKVFSKMAQEIDTGAE